MKYLNKQIKMIYDVTDEDYIDWCKKNKKPITYKSSIQAFIYRVRTNRLIKDCNGRMVVKKSRGNK